MKEREGVAPITVKFMLACYCGPDPAGEVGADHWDSSAGKETREWLLGNGLIGEDNRATPRGQAWVQFFCRTPLPVVQWSLPSRGMGETS